MIKFFRKIRQKLLSEGKTVMYLKYALGEIVLVVIGILIALQINNWNENRKQKIKEREILNFTIENLQADSASIGRLLESAERMLKIHEDLVKLSKGEIQESDVTNLDALRITEANQIITKRNNLDLPNQVRSPELKRSILLYFVLTDYLEFIISVQNENMEQYVRPFFGEKNLFNYSGTSQGTTSNLINRERFFREFKNEEIKQILFEARGKSVVLKRIGERMQSKNAELLQVVKKYLDEQ